MNKNLFTHLFIWCFVLGFAFTAIAQVNSVSIGRAPVNAGHINYNFPPAATVTTGYGADGINNTWNSVSIPDGALTQIGPTGGILHQGGDFDG